MKIHGESHESREETIQYEFLLIIPKWINLRFSDILLPVLKVTPKLINRHPSAIGLGSHESKCGLQDCVGKLFVVSPHAFPEIMHNVFDGNRPYAASSVRYSRSDQSVKIHGLEERHPA